MSFSGIIPMRGSITDDMRTLFVKLAIATEVRDAGMWCLMGDEQEQMTGFGSFRREGRYLLKSAAKRWTTGRLYASSRSYREVGVADLYYAVLPTFVALSTSRDALVAVLPTDAPVHKQVRRSKGAPCS